MRPIQAVGDWVIAYRPEEEQTTPGGIVLPEYMILNPHIAEVVSVSMRTEEKLGLSHGDVILFTGPNREIEVEGETLLAIRPDDVMAVVERGGE